MTETIFALATAPGRAGVAILRISGFAAQQTLQQLTGSPSPPARKMTSRPIADANGNLIDHGLVVFFAAPASYTGEDVVELHVHGGRAVIDALFRELRRLGLRPAERGEFTRRAVENGKLDLTEAEGVADLVDAETEAQRRQALEQVGGSLLRTYEDWRSRLVQCIAWLEAAIDFSDEDLPEDLFARARSEAEVLAGEVSRHLDDGRRGEILREGVHLTVIGPPNAGKSSLINALAKRDVAIVAETAGTTRDIVEARLDLDGYPVIVADTAGLREAAEAVEAEGVRRALARVEHADLVLLLLDGTRSDPGVSRETVGRADLVVWNKADLQWPIQHDGTRLSLKTAEGLPELIGRLSQLARQRLERPREGAPLTRARHRYALEEAQSALQRAVSAPSAELLAEDVRLAMRAIGCITGRVDIEEVLDSIFLEFCIGK